MNTQNNDASYQAGNIAVTLLAYQNMIKIYHWQTPKYSRHKASDKLFKNMVEKFDQLVEVLQGSWGTRISFGTTS